MIIKLSVRELRGLIASRPVPAEGLKTVTHPIGDGKTKSIMTTTGGGPCFVGKDGVLRPCGSDRDVDRRRIETLERVADFNERAFVNDAGVFARDTTDWAKAKAEADREAVGSLYRESAEAQGDGRRPDRDRPAATPGMLRRMGFPTFCEEPVYADVPPMPEGFPHDCPAAAFARGFSEAFRPWLDSFDAVVRKRRKGEWLAKGLTGFADRRPVDMEAYAKTDTVAFVRFFEPSDGDGEDRRTLYRQEVVVTNWADVMPLLSSHIDKEVSNLARSLHVDDDGMREVRDGVVRSDCGDIRYPNEAEEEDGPMTEWERRWRADSVAKWMERWLGDFEGWFLRVERKVKGRRLSEVGTAGQADGISIDAHPSRDGLRVRLMAHKRVVTDGKADEIAVYDEERALPERDDDLSDWEADFIRALLDKVEWAYPWCDVDGFLDGRSGGTPFDGKVSYMRNRNEDEDEDEDGDGGDVEECGDKDDGRTTDVTDADRDEGLNGRLERLSSALWGRLRMMSEAMNHLLDRQGGGRRLVVNVIRDGGHADLIVNVQVVDCREGWVRSRCFTTGLSDVEWDDYDALADALVPVWSREVTRDISLCDWGRWRERKDEDRHAETKDYEARDEEDAEKVRREMAEVERGIAGDLCDQPDEREAERPKKGGRKRRAE